MKQIILKREIISGSLKGIVVEIAINVRTASDLDWLKMIGQEVKACAGPDYIVLDAYVKGN